MLKKTLAIAIAAVSMAGVGFGASTLPAAAAPMMMGHHHPMMMDHHHHHWQRHQVCRTVWFHHHRHTVCHWM